MYILRPKKSAQVYSYVCVYARWFRVKSLGRV